MLFSLCFEWARLIAAERCGLPQQRRPEPQSVMTDPAAVEAFHGAGFDLLAPIYCFNTRRVSRLAPLNGRVLDLGSGSGQFLRLLAARRPDLTIVGLEPSPAMRALGRERIVKDGLSGKIQLIEGDMTELTDPLPGPLDVITSLFALHHLPREGDLARCFEQIRRIRDRDGAALWLFDHARPRGSDTAGRFAALATARRSAILERDSANSLAAAFSFDEWATAWTAAGLPNARHRLANFLPVYQAIECPGARTPARPEPMRPPRGIRRSTRLRAALFGTLFAGGR
ncbi:MAG: class I SAM-dependent methyltransferase [Elusimicrobia bacterium]|jgi:SAM-dependent methyltransferase|nr:class I SAM-dependent methyltransferase [Elusimicrobiota bacterium]MBK8424004.1 class I SAM-dependent methyltransferase [Elusimicrobiota bacterium]